MEKKQQQFDGVRVQSGEDLSSVRASYSKDGKYEIMITWTPSRYPFLTKGGCLSVVVIQ